jgi:hypothetical protein
VIWLSFDAPGSVGAGFKAAVDVFGEFIDGF